MATYVFPAVFHKNEDGSFTIFFPDLPGCISEGKNIENSIYMAQSALSQWVQYLHDKKEAIPSPSPIGAISTERCEFTSYVRADVRDERAVRRTISLPKWMDEQASAKGLSLSKVLQEALSAKLL